jgi:hypothetical protein
VYADGRYQLTQALLEMNDWRVLQEKVAANSK